MKWQDFGNGVWQCVSGPVYPPQDWYPNVISEFKREHPDLVVTAIVRPLSSTLVISVENRKTEL